MHEQRDAIAGHQPQAVAQVAGLPRDAFGQFAITGHDALAVQQRRVLRVHPRRALQPARQVHARALSCAASCGAAGWLRRRSVASAISSIDAATPP